MIAIDIGCARHHDAVWSVERIVERFKPPILYAFDPLAETPFVPYVGKTRIFTVKAAVWTRDGEIGFSPDGTRSRISASSLMVPCISLADFICSKDDMDIVLKIDAEGAEYALLEQLREQDLDKRLRIAWVEWHPETHDGDRSREDSLKNRLRCKVEDWVY